jgi:large subunit ribosomal protein L18
MNIHKAKNEKMARRRKRIRAKISGTKDVPRLSVFKSNKFIYAQIIDDEKGATLAAHSSVNSKTKKPIEKAKEVGVELAKKAIAAKIHKVVFDRGGYLYTGHIKALADGAREGGLKF